MLDADVLNYLAVILAAQTISPTSDDFEAHAELMARTRRQLLAALAEIEPPAEEPQPNRETRRAAAKANGRAKTTA